MLQNTNAIYGQAGSVLISDTTQHDVDCFAVQVIEDAQFSVLTDASRAEFTAANKKLADATQANTIIVPAGTVLFGQITSIKLHTGTVIAIKG